MQNGVTHYKRIDSQAENPFAKLIPHQQIAIIPSFTLDSGVVLHNVPVAYSTKGRLSPQRDNVLLICHALSGSADVGDWWGPLLGGPGRAFDVSRFFVVCINALGSPYGSASPVTSKDGDAGKGRYGPEFPLTTVRDDVRLSKLLLDDLGVASIASVVGGSMGGMVVLEFAYLGVGYVRTIVPIATSARHSAWCISWGEAQRQSIYSDPKYEDGYYALEDPPSTGLGAARMSALLTYRSRDSFESRFGRKVPQGPAAAATGDAQRPSTPSSEHFAIHNEGHKNAGSPRQSFAAGEGASADMSSPSAVQSFFVPMSRSATANGDATMTITDPQFHGATPQPIMQTTAKAKSATYFSAQSYLRYQGDKFIRRFDANCYIAVTRKLDTHDISLHCADDHSEDPLYDALQLIQQPTLVLGIESDGLFTFSEQKEIARGIPRARLEKIDSPEGHDAFLLQFEQVNKYITDFFLETMPDIMTRAPDLQATGATTANGFGPVTKSSTFGEAEVGDITAW